MSIKTLFADNVCYYADYEHYEQKEKLKTVKSKNPYDEKIRKGQHLIDLKKLCQACEVEGIKIASINGINDDVIAEIKPAIEGKRVLVDIGQKKDGEILVNTVGNFRKPRIEDLM